MRKILKLSAAWCTPCKDMDAQIERLKGDIRVPIEVIDVNSNPEYTKKYRVRSIPTLIKLDESGVEYGRHTGILQDTKFLDFVNE